MSTPKSIKVSCAREHNLQDVSVAIPRDKLVVITGPSGSGKSSLAFDTIYAEAQRRFMESLSTYARQFLEQAQKPEVDSIEGLSPAVAIEQRTGQRNPRSTVGTMTEVYDFLRVLFARAGTPWCDKYDRPITRQSAQDIRENLATLPEGAKVQLLAPQQVPQGDDKIETLLGELRAQGYIRVRINEALLRIDESYSLPKKIQQLDVVVDRLVMSETLGNRLSDSIELALSLGAQQLRALISLPNGDPEERQFTEAFSCAECGLQIPELRPQLFSFNSPHGACEECHGLGTVRNVALELVVPDETLSLKQGAIHPWSVRKKLDAMFGRTLVRVCKHYDIPETTPWNELPEDFKNVVLYGSGEEKGDFAYRGRRRKRGVPFEGVIPNLTRRYHEAESEKAREFLNQFMREQVCPSCKGARLKKTALIVRVQGKTISEIADFSIAEALQFFEELQSAATSNDVIKTLCRHIIERLSFLADTGLEYLTLSRAGRTLSGGEAQRIRLASQLGAGLTGVLYVLDEPSIGLHARDNQKLIDALCRLRDNGNSVLVVEHDEETIRAADHIIDLGPGAGEYGGRIVAEGTLAEIVKNAESVTGPYLSGEKSVHRPNKRRVFQKKNSITLRGAEANNLKSCNVEFPLGLFTCVTGVSGSGKSSLVNDTLYPAIHRALHSQSRQLAAPHKSLTGHEAFESIIAVDQAPIGKTPRSNPATYTGIFNVIRDIFSKVPEARARGYTPGRFSFNVKGGRCERCHGAGLIAIDMHFLPDLHLTCPVCNGSRYNRDTLEIRYRGLNIAEILDLPIAEARETFKNLPAAKRRLDALCDVGLGYLRLGQAATTLSGGEAQRVKLATELAKQQRGNNIYILDEPTTGLHPSDIDTLLKALHYLVDAGNTVIVIEHNTDVILSADWLIDLGPDGGEKGGEVIATGTPEDVSEVKRSRTGNVLKKILDEKKRQVRKPHKV